MSVNHVPFSLLLTRGSKNYFAIAYVLKLRKRRLFPSTFTFRQIDMRQIIYDYINFSILEMFIYRTFQ